MSDNYIHGADVHYPKLNACIKKYLRALKNYYKIYGKTLTRFKQLKRYEMLAILMLEPNGYLIDELAQPINDYLKTL